MGGKSRSELTAGFDESAERQIAHVRKGFVDPCTNKTRGIRIGPSGSEVDEASGALSCIVHEGTWKWGRFLDSRTTDGRGSNIAWSQWNSKLLLSGFKKNDISGS